MPTVSDRTHGPQTLTIDPAPVAVRAAAAGDTATGREFSGIAVPFNTPIDIYGFREQFAPGSIETGDDVLVCWRHDDPIGRVTAHQDTDEGWSVDGSISDTTRGQEAATLLRDGVIRKLSVRFEPLEWTESKGDDGVSLITYTRARVDEVSLVPIPAYDDASISSVRHRPTTEKEATPMPNTTDSQVTAADLNEVRSGLDELTRRVELIPAHTTDDTPDPVAQLRAVATSFGEFIAKIARGDEAAMRAYDGVVLDDVLIDSTDTSWVGRVRRLLDARTPLTNFFNHTRDLPPTGNTVEYGELELSTLAVGEQATEGDPLSYGKVSIQAGQSAPVITLGGWTDMSRQSIERSPYSVVDLAFRGFAIAYATKLEQLTSTLLSTTYAARVTAGGAAVIDFAAFDTDTVLDADDLIDLLLTIAERYQDSPYSADGVLVASDVFRRLAHVPEKRKALQITAAPTDKVGTLMISSAEANLSNLPFSVWPGAAAGAAAVVDKQALRVQESAGAPFRLQDGDITNLTQQFSVYGYAAAYAEMPEGIVPIVGFDTETGEDTGV